MLKTKLILALDFDNIKDAEKMVKLTRDRVDIYKVGSVLFTYAGPRAIEMVRHQGKEVFLDLKFYDIPNTVMGAARAAGGWGVNMFTVHCSGGVEMMRGALKGASDGPAGAGSRARVIGVTLLTSLDAAADTVNRVLSLAKDAVEAGIDGVVCSPMEVSHLKRAWGDRLLTVVPGIRLAEQGKHDQARVATPAQAARDGADFMVIGRSITQSKSPLDALSRILSEVEHA